MKNTDCTEFHSRFMVVLNVRLSLCLGLIIGIPLLAAAGNLTTLATLTGRCVAVTAMDVVTNPSFCSNTVVNLEFPNGRVGFMFNINKKENRGPVIISFFGDGKKQLHIDRDTAVQPIDRVHFTFQGSTDDLVVSGSCRFSNPYKGVPSKITCSADSTQGKFSGDFISNGTSPNVSQIQ